LGWHVIVVINILHLRLIKIIAKLYPNVPLDTLELLTALASYLYC
jgi:hypothetical protein